MRLPWWMLGGKEVVGGKKEGHEAGRWSKKAILVSRNTRMGSAQGVRDGSIVKGQLNGE